MVVTVTVFFVRSVHSSNYRMGFRRALLRPLLVFIGMPKGLSLLVITFCCSVISASDDVSLSY